jgi:hypothetical protein
LTPDACDQLAIAGELGSVIDKKGPNDAILGDDMRVLEDAPPA